MELLKITKHYKITAILLTFMLLITNISTTFANLTVQANPIPVRTVAQAVYSEVDVAQSVYSDVIDTVNPLLAPSINENLVGNLGINTTNLESDFVYSPYNVTMAASGGTEPYTWSATGLPAGLSIDSTTGIISGIPTEAGTATVDVIVNDSTGQSVTSSYSLTLMLAPPSNLVVTTHTGYTATLDWTASVNNTGIIGYEINRDGVNVGTSTSTSYIDTGLEPNNSYSYSVLAYDSAGNVSGMSNSSTVTTYLDDYGDLITTASAIQMQIEALSEINYPGDEDYLSFTTPIGGNYIIKSSGELDTFGYLYDDTGNLLAENDDNIDDSGNEDINFAITQTLSANKTYFVRVKSSQSNITGEYGISVLAPDEIPPTVPQDLVVTTYSAKTVSLKWSASTDDIALAGYEIYRDGYKVGSVADVAFTDSGIIPNTVYSYTVKAYDVAGNISVESNNVNITTDKAGAIKDNPIAGGSNHSISIKEGKVWTWGYNGYGQLGDGTTINRATAVQVQGLSGFKAVSGGSYHSLALKDDGTIWAWGYGGYGQLGDGTWNTTYTPVQVTGLTSVSAITTGDYHSVALSDGQVWAWGNNGNGQLGDGTYNYRTTPVQVPGLTGVKAIAAGANYTLALKDDGTVWAWGYGSGWGSYLTPYQVQGLTGITAISARGYHNVALKNNGTVWTWETGYQSAVQVDGLSEITAVAAGNSHTMALKNDGTVWTWGSNSNGQLGDGTTTDRSTPAQVAELTDVVAIADGTNHSLAKQSNGTNWAWGYNAEGEIGDGSTSTRTTPVISGDTQPPSQPSLTGTLTETAISLTWLVSTDNVGVTGYAIYRDGSKIGTTADTSYTDNLTLGQTFSYLVKAFDAAGNESEASNLVANEFNAPSIPESLTVTAKSVKTVSLIWDASTDDVGVVGYEIYRDGTKIGATSSIGYTDSGLAPNTTYSYTIKAYDAIGNISEPSTSVEVTTDEFVMTSGSLAGGTNHSMTIKEGTVWTWGYNNYGQLGDGTNTNRTTAVQVPGLSGFKAVAGGAIHSLALKDDGTIWAWGYGGHGQLGDGTWNTYYAPVQVPELTSVSAIAAGDYHSVALSDGRVWTWGANWNGQLGDGTYDYRTTPVQVPGLTGVTAIAAGANYTLALKDDGTVWVWGYGSDWNYYVTPYQVQGLTGITAISARGNHNAALKNDGTAWTWDTWNQSAIQVDGLSEITAVAAGNSHTMALKNDGTVWTWGSNNYGQLGDGTTSDRPTPAQVVDLTDVVVIASGTNHSLAKQSNGTIWAWGYNAEGEIGDGGISNRTAPVIAADTQPPSKLSLTGTLSETEISLTWSASTDNVGVTGYAIYRDGNIIGTTTDTSYTDNLMLGQTFSYVVKAFDAAGNESEASNSVVNEHNAPSIPTGLTVVAKTVKSVSLTWEASTDDVGLVGYEIYRDGIKVGTTASTDYTDDELAPNTTYNYSVKAYDVIGNISELSTSVEVTTNEFVMTSGSLAGGNNHSMTIKEGTVWTWGYNNYGQLGDGTTTNRTTAVQVPGLSGFKAVAGGAIHSLALKDDGTIWAWGYGGHGQLGDGTWNTYYAPVQVPELTSVSAIAAGDYHSVALSDGRVWTWGANWNGQLGDGTYDYRTTPVQVPGLTGVAAIAAGANYTLALKNDGTVWAWGYGNGWNNYVTPYQVQGLDGITAISSRGNYNVALKNDGTAWTWETWNQSAVQVDGLSQITAVAAGNSHTMVLKNDGTVWTWGNNTYGQLGDGTISNSSTPAQVAVLTDVIAIASGAYHSLAKQSDGTIWAWGYNTEGEIGDGSTNNRTAPVIAADTQPPSQLSLTGTLSETTISLTWSASTDNVGVTGYAIYRDGTIIGTTTDTSYTDNLTLGQTFSYVVKAFDAAGNESEASNSVVNEHNAPSIPTGLTVAAKSVKTVSLTWEASTDDVGLVGYEIYRDGTKVGTTPSTDYTDSELAPNTTYNYMLKAYDVAGNISESSTSVEVTTDELVIQVSSLAGGNNHSMTIKEGTVWTWGYNNYGQLGDGTNTNRTTAVQVPGLSGFKAVSGGFYHSLALKDDGTIWAWGYGGYGQLGDGTWNTYYAPVQVPELTSVSAIAAGDYHSVALSDGRVWTWGANWNGQLGDGTYDYRTTPVQVPGLTEVTAIAAGANYTLALKNDGTVWAWGYGNGWNNYVTPYQVQGLDGITAISSRGNHNVALKNDGTAWTWETWNQSAIQVDGLSEITAVAAGNSHTMALKNDGTVWTWGSNSYGQLGDGTNADRNVPVKVKKLTSGVIAIAGGSYHSLAFKSDGTVWCWGFNGEGQLGDKTTTNRTVAVIAAGDTQAPSAPTSLKASSTETSVTLTWMEATDNIEIAGYDIYRDETLIATTTDLTYTDSGLTPGVRYTYFVKAYDGSGNISQASDSVVNDYQAPSAPENLRLSSSTYISVVLAWDVSTDDVGVTGYEIYRNGDKVGTTIDTSYVDQEVTPNTNYIYTIKAFDAGDNLSIASDPLNVTTDIDTQAPTAPSNLALASDSLTFVELTWSAAKDDAGVAGYEIYRDGNKLDQTSATSFTDNFIVELGVTYTYTIKAYDSSGNMSEAGTITLIDEHGNSLESATPIDPSSETAGIINYPEDLDYVTFVAPVSGTYVIKSTGQTDTYGILYDSNGQQLTYNDDANDGKNFLITQNLVTDQSYYLAVSNYVGTSTGTYGIKIMIPDTQAPTPPGDLIVSTKTLNAISFSWTASTDYTGVTGYEIYRDGVLVGTSIQTSYTDTGLTVGTTYTYTLKAYDAVGNLSDFSTSLSIATEQDTQAPSAPAGLIASAVSASTVALTWNPATDNLGVVGYEIYRDGNPVGTVNTLSFTDIGLTENTAYAYTVKAFDAAGNSSETSNTVIAVPILPHITSVSPIDGLTLGGAKTESLYLYFRNNGALGEMLAEFEYSVDGTNWTTIPSVIYGPYIDDTETAYFKANWDLTDLSSANYQVRYTLSDSSDTNDQNIVSYTIDRTSPAAPMNTLATANPEGTINLAWEQSPAADVSYYQIYRSTNSPDSFNPLAQLNGRFNVTYADHSVLPGETYYYKVSTVDKFNQEGLASNVANVIAVNDTVPPQVLGFEPSEGKTLGSQASITVKAQDSSALASVTLQYSVSEDVWVDIATLDTTDQATFDWDTSAIMGQVKVRAIARDAAGNVSDGSPIRTYNIDNQGPAKVTGLTGNSSATSALLSWKDVPDQDFAYFVVERKDSTTGDFHSVGSVNNQLGFNVTGLNINSTYWFRVVAYDQYANRGTPSDELQIITTSDTTAPVVSGIGPSPGFFAQQIQLSATANDEVGVTAITFQISGDQENWQDLSTITPQATQGSVSVSYTLDVSAYAEGTWYVRGIASDAAGNLSNPSGFVQYVVDHTPPAQTQGLTVTPKAGDITLHWDQGQENDLAAYRVYRAQNQAGPYNVLADKLMVLGYVDRAVEADQIYFYKVSALDKAGNESLATEPMLGQLLADTELPRIISASPNDATTLPANPVINILAADNYRMAKVSAVYQAEGETGEQWLPVGSQDLNVSSQVVSFNWDTSSLTDGQYTVRFIATDLAGNISEPMDVTYNLNLIPPAAPVITLTPGGWQINLTWTSANENDLAGFRVYRSTTPGGQYQLITQTTGTSYLDEMLEPGRNYYYVVDALDQYRNTSRSEEVSGIPTSADPYFPKAVVGDDQMVVLGAEVAFDGTKSSDNDRIAQYVWDFGDGTTSSVAQPRHTYTLSGTYQVKLTVYDPAQNSSEATVNITVRDPQQVGTLEVRVLDDGGNSLYGASIVIQFPDGTMQNAISDGRGLATVIANPGTYKVYAYKNEFKPVSIDATLVLNQKTTALVRLQRGQLVVGELTVKRMNLEEIKAAGIDVSAPENQWVYNFEVHLAFDNQPLTPVTYMVNGTGSFVGGSWQPLVFTNPNPGTGGSPGTYIAYPAAIPHFDHPEVRPTIAYMVIPGEARWLKEFFEVGLTLENTADQEFVITDSKATLHLPEGLTLAPTPQAQSLTVDLGDLAGGETRQTKWIIRGDQKGYYELEADFSGMLQPFNDLVQSIFRTKEPFRVWGDDALRMHVETQNRADQGYPYNVRFGLENVSDIPVYNAAIELKDGGKQNYIYAPNQELAKSITELKPGETFWADYQLIPSISGTLDLSESYILKTGGNATVQTDITEHAEPQNVPGITPVLYQSHNPDGTVTLSWDSVAEATGYKIYTIRDDLTISGEAERVYTAQAMENTVTLPESNGTKDYIIMTLMPEGEVMRHAITGLSWSATAGDMVITVNPEQVYAGEETELWITVNRNGIPVVGGTVDVGTFGQGLVLDQNGQAWVTVNPSAAGLIPVTAYSNQFSVTTNVTVLEANYELIAMPLVQIGENPKEGDSLGLYVGLENIVDLNGNTLDNSNIAEYQIEVNFDPAKIAILDVVDEANLDQFTVTDSEAGKVTIAGAVANGTTSYRKLFFLPIALIGSALDSTSLRVNYLKVSDSSNNSITIESPTDQVFQRGKIHNEALGIQPNISDAVAGLQYLAGQRNAGVNYGQVNPINMASIIGEDLSTAAIKPGVKDIVALLQYLVQLRDPFFNVVNP